jgi:probable rRNA maturation factor
VKQLIFGAVDAALAVEGLTHDCEVNVTIVSDAKIKEINSSFRNINKSTDVLSFPLTDGDEYEVNPENGYIMLGDVIISIEHAMMQADEYGHGLEREIAYLTVHSMFHLMGYDHIDEGVEKKIMRKKEEEALVKLGLQII